MNHFHKTFDGLFTFPDFYSWVAEQMRDGAHLVEVGVYTGQSAAYLGVELLNRGVKNARLDLVDLFTAGGSPDVVRDRLKPIAEVIGVLHQGNSWEQAALYEDGSLDLIFIDASHRYDDVIRDIDAWLPKLKPGIGILAGHDYKEWPEFGVIRAVRERFRVEDIAVWQGTDDCTDANMLGKFWPCWCVVDPASKKPPPAPKMKPAKRPIRNDLVSVIVPCHKQSQYLHEALDSVRAQTYRKVEVILACGDEDSQKAAWDYLHDHCTAIGLWRPDGAQFKVLSGLVKGLADARNQAIGQATGRYIACLDADDTWEPTYLEKMVYASPQEEPLSIATCDLRRFGSRTDTLRCGPWFEANEKGGNVILVCSLFSKKLWELVGGYNNAIFGAEDWLMWIQCAKFNPVVSKVNEFLFNYRTHAEQGSAFCEKHDGVLRAAIRILAPEIFGAPERSDILTIITCPEEVREKFLQRAEWFPSDPQAQRFAALLNSETRKIFVP